jgi:spermidine/putrescine transport system ATP-binding protein
MSADISLRGLTKRFGSMTAVDALDLDVPAGTFFALLGPSGCGKTTTLRMIGGFEDPTDGRVHLGGEDVTDRPPFKRDVNTVFQSYALFPHLDVARNVAFGLERRKVDKAEIRRRVGEVLELTQLGGFEKRKPGQLSGGQQQRVALARALVNRPKALLLDEPLGALDLRLRRQLQLELKRIQQEVGITFVHVTHDQEEAMTMADEIAVMNEGRVEQRGGAEDLYERPNTAFVAQFLGTSNLIDGKLVGRGEFQTSSGVRLQVPDTNGHTPSGDLCAGVRPEKIELLPAESAPRSGENTLEGQVTVASFLGTAFQYVVTTTAGEEVTVVEQNRNGTGVETLGPGRKVVLCWKPDHTFVVARQGGDRPHVA